MAAEDARAVAAAEWLARRVLGESARDEGFSDWVGADPANQGAYGRAEAIWADLDSVVRAPRASANVVPLHPAAQARRRPAWLAPTMAIAATLLLCLVSVLSLRRDGQTFDTRVGERRVIVLEDESRVTLNTDTRIAVAFDKTDRVIRLERGEALFNVAHDAGRPFFVRADGGEVRAIGTRFMVRRDGARLAVTLLEGKVAVRKDALAPILLEPGDRVVLGSDAVALRDRPQIDTVTAWQRGELILRHTPVAEAVREMNRYSQLRIELEAPRASQARLTGVYKLGHSTEFARTLSALYGLPLRERGDSLTLGERPQKN